MSGSKNFYYHFKPLNFWLLLNIIFTCIIACCFANFHSWHYLSQFYILIITVIISWAAWIFKHCFKQCLAVITDEYIKIDHCQPLLWENVIDAEEKIIKCCFKEFKIIILNTKPDMKYKYNFLQQHIRYFTPFSLPLYEVISKEDATVLKEIIADKVKYTSLSDENEDEDENEPIRPRH